MFRKELKERVLLLEMENEKLLERLERLENPEKYKTMPIIIDSSIYAYEDPLSYNVLSMKYRKLKDEELRNKY